MWPRNIENSDEIDDDSLVVVLRPLMALRVPDFEVALTTTVSEEVKARLGVLPFRLIRRQTTGLGFYTTDDD